MRNRKRYFQTPVKTAITAMIPADYAWWKSLHDAATPITFHHYTGNWKGSIEGWMVTPKTWNWRISKTLPRLDNFYMAGQWVEPGG